MRIQCGYSEEEEEEEEEAEEEEEEDCGVQWGYRGVQQGYDVPYSLLSPPWQPFCYPF